MKTDLNFIKSKAIEYLNIDPIVDSNFSCIVYHTFINCNPIPFKDCYSNKFILLDVINNKENFKKCTDKIRDDILNSDNLFNIIFMLNKPYRFSFFKSIKDYLSKEDFNYYLKDIWISTEFPNADKNVKSNIALSLFKRSDKNILMTKEEFEYLKSLPNEVTIYRGTHKKDNSKALSWIDYYSTALWFAKRFDGNGYVLKVSINKKNIIAFFNARNENELIIDFNKIYNLKEEKIIDIKI